MSITIKTKREVRSDGVLGRIILKVDLLNKEDLPELYKNNDNCIYGWKGDSYSIVIYKRINILTTGEFISEEDFQKNLAIIRMAGELLHEINEKLKALREAWCGEETFTI